MAAQLERKEISTDVLVIGGGGAGAMAAIKTMMEGADVLVATKGKYPSGNTSIAAWGYAVALGHSDPRDSPQVHFEDALVSGNGLNDQKLLRTWTTDIVELHKEMDSWGNLPLNRDGDKFAQLPWEGHTYPRMVNMHGNTGKAVIQCLSNKSKEMGVPVLEDTIIGGIMKKDDAVAGAWGIDYQNGQLIFIKAKTIILTTGGLGHLYPITDNVKTITGEGYSLAFRAGAELIGMEFNHFLPTIGSPEKIKGLRMFRGAMNALINKGDARLYNAFGERFMKQHFPDVAEKIKGAEIFTRAISHEICIGKGTANGGVYMDVSSVPKEMQEEDQFNKFWNTVKRADVDLNYQPLELAPSIHDHVGGIKIDVKAGTAVPGLFSAGEVAGGSHGASRFGGAALSDALAFGAIAAKSAVDYSRELQKHHPLDENQIADVQNKIESLLSTKQGIKSSEVKEKVQGIAKNYLIPVRSEDGLNKALNVIMQLEQEELPKMSAWAKEQKQGLAGLRLAIEVDGQLELAKIIATAALCRQESRGGFFGGHYRSDFPDQDDKNWLKNIILKRGDDGTISSRTEPPVMDD